MTEQRDRDSAAPRSLKHDGEELRFRAYPEVIDEIDGHARDMARDKKNEEIPYEPGETRGPSWTMNRLLCWYLSLTDEDRRQIQSEGEALFAECRKLPRKYKGKLPFPRRAETIFAGPSGGAMAAVDGRPIRSAGKTDSQHGNRKSTRDHKGIVSPD